MIPAEYSEHIFAQSLRFVKWRTLLLPGDFVNAKIDNLLCTQDFFICRCLVKACSSTEFRYANLQGSILTFPLIQPKASIVHF